MKLVCHRHLLCSGFSKLTHTDKDREQAVDCRYSLGDELKSNYKSIFDDLYYRCEHQYNIRAMCSGTLRWEQESGGRSFRKRFQAKYAGVKKRSRHTIHGRPSQQPFSEEDTFRLSNHFSLLRLFISY